MRDSRFEEVGERFDRIDDHILEFRRETNARFDSLQREMNARFDGLQRAMLQSAVVLATGLLGVIGALVATGI